MEFCTNKIVILWSSTCLPCADAISISRSKPTLDCIGIFFLSNSNQFVDASLPNGIQALLGLGYYSMDYSMRSFLGKAASRRGRRCERRAPSDVSPACLSGDKLPPPIQERGLQSTYRPSASTRMFLAGSWPSK